MPARSNRRTATHILVLVTVEAIDGNLAGFSCAVNHARPTIQLSQSIIPLYADNQATVDRGDGPQLSERVPANLGFIESWVGKRHGG
jgi:hypothetical protein